MSSEGRPFVRATEVAPVFDGARLTLARHLAGMRKSDLATLIGKSPTAVAGWEAGLKRPTAATVGELALGLQVDPGFFAVRREPVASASSAPHFRSLRSTTQIARDQALAFGQLAIDVATTMEMHVEFPPADLPALPVESNGSTCSEPEQAASLVRERWGLGDGPLGHAVRLVETHGVLVVFSPIQTADVDAYSFDSRLRPVIVLNPIKRDYYRQRFDLAHELGHLIMHGDAEPGGQVVEDQANRFAAELLMPASSIRSLLPTHMGSGSWLTLGRLKEQWGVSMQALLFRARQLGTVTDVSYRNAMAAVSKRGWRRNEPGLVEVVEQPSLLPRAVSLLTEEGFDIDQLVAQCRVPRRLFEQICARTPPVVPSSEANQPSAPDRPSQVVSLLRATDLPALTQVEL